ncbi:hypothetical protein AVEN_5251-1 [Araneus ventricosus]|uniref:Uncharacterized protein n=1 Tax=Araneus ventricosus TaxID=182803 RepID=A0A4Y2ML98_ARAVE|nr:hypothetical protein AVEN_5251-1 [Araneus ventricosus]
MNAEIAYMPTLSQESSLPLKMIVKYRGIVWELGYIHKDQNRVVNVWAGVVGHHIIRPYLMPPRLDDLHLSTGTPAGTFQRIQAPQSLCLSVGFQHNKISANFTDEVLLVVLPTVISSILLKDAQ